MHDCAKGTDDDPAPLLALAAEAKLAVTAVQAADPVTFLHAPLGAYVARRDYGVEDTAILQAIERHTSGHPHPSRLDKILYLADAIEPGRKSADAIRELALRDLDEAYYQLFVKTMAKAIEKGWFLDPLACETYNALLRQRS